MEIHLQTYREEAHELLAELEESLLELEETPDDMELVGRVFRAMHTIKGSGAMFGFDDVEAFTHEIETVYDLVRSGKIGVDKDLIDLTLAARDQIKKMVDGESADLAVTGEIISSLHALLPEETPIAAAPSAYVAKSNADADGGRVTYRIRFRPDVSILTSGTNPLLLLDELRSLGTCRVVAQTNRVPPLAELDPEGCYLYWDVVLSTDAGIDAIKDVFIFVEDNCELIIDIIDEEDVHTDEIDYKKLGQILTERGDLSITELDRILGRQKRLGEMLVDAEAVDRGLVCSALVEQQHIRQMRKQEQEAVHVSSIRVPTEKLDTLVDLVGELVTMQARLSQSAASLNDPELFAVAEQVEQLTGDLRDNTMIIRMLPIGTTFSKFKRVVRDLAAELGKEVVLTTEGGETELDKTVIEKLNDPLVHIIRNSIDHGIEPPQAREALGKPREGTVHLSAVHSGANVLVRISDNGAGLDPEAIRKKAVEKGLIASDAELTEKEIFSQLFVAGFSTSERVTDVSGRGVGMDVVKRSIDTLRGTVDISSKKGQGTTITLSLPLTLAIIDGLLVKIEEGDFVLPLSAVEECIELTHDDVAKAHGRHMIHVREQIVPYIPLRSLFHVTGEVPPIQQIVITETNGSRIGFVVDRVIGEHQTVIKSLGRIYRDVEGISGATILGDGTVALILDIPNLVKCAEREELGSAAKEI
jgi:two-component system chemotaxis sensor kinase CheA